MGWAEGFEPSATGTTIRRSTKLSYAHHEGLHHRIKDMQLQQTPRRYHPTRFHISSTRSFTSADISITPGHGRVKPSPGHLRVASIPIFEP